MRTALQIVRDHYAGSAAQDLDQMMAEVADDVQWTEMLGFPCAGTHIGPAQVIDKVFKVLGTEWENYTFRLQQLIDGGDTVVAIGDYTGIYRKTGKAVRARVAHVWCVEGGKVRRFEQFTDTLLVAQAMQ